MRSMSGPASLLWQYDPKVADQPDAARKGMRVTWGNRGIAWWNGKVYTGTVDGRLIAIDARTGKEVWSVQTTTKGDGRFITGAPRAFDGKIVVGQGGGDTTPTRAYATAYDAETGKQLWRFFVVPGDPAKGFENKAMAMAAKTWTGEWWKLGGGGHPWNAFAYDRDTNTVLIGTGNGFPWNQRVRSPGGGDNLFLCSVVAVDATTGQYKWHYQYNPGETWDYNAAMDIELADLMIGGKPRKVMLQAPKNGFLYVIDRTNGQLISAEKIARVTWASKIDLKTGRPVENPAARFPNGQSFDMWPATEGAHSWQPMAYSPQTKLLYIPKIEQGFTYSDKGFDLKGWKPDGGANVAESIGPAKPNPVLYTSALLAWNPATQKMAWKVDTRGGWTGGVLATAGNLVFQGQIDGKFSAYAADSGKELWRFDAAGGGDRRADLLPRRRQAICHGAGRCRHQPRPRLARAGRDDHRCAHAAKAGADLRPRRQGKPAASAPALQGQADRRSRLPRRCNARRQRVGRVQQALHHLPRLAGDRRRGRPRSARIGGAAVA